VFGEAEPQVLDVGHRLLQQQTDVLVVQGVDDAATVARAGHEAEVAQDAELPAREPPSAGRDDAFATLERRVDELERALAAIKASLGIE